LSICQFFHCHCQLLCCGRLCIGMRNVSCSLLYVVGCVLRPYVIHSRRNMRLSQHYLELFLIYFLGLKSLSNSRLTTITTQLIIAQLLIVLATLHILTLLRVVTC
jgi:hypothetical protein